MSSSDTPTRDTPGDQTERHTILGNRAHGLSRMKVRLAKDTGILPVMQNNIVVLQKAADTVAATGRLVKLSRR